MLVALALIACKNPPSVVYGPAEWIDGSAAAGFRVESTTGPAPHTAVVRAVNDWGAAVTAASTQLTVDGTPYDVAFDGLGYGSVVRPDPGTSVIEGAASPAVVGAYAGPALDGFFPAVESFGTATAAAGATGGALVATGSSVWWVDADHRYPVLTFPDGDVVGLQSGNLDTDGIMDAIAWSADTLVLLRGRNGGGVAWGAGLQADEGIVSATLGDADTDGHADVAVLWDGPDGVEMEVLWGGSGWDFARSETTSVDSSAIAVGIGDAKGDGAAQITVTLPTAWERFLLNERVPTITGPNFSDMAFAAGGGIRSSDDLNGDGGAEIITWGPFVADGPRDLLILDLMETGNAKTVNLPIATGGRFTFADVSGDGRTDALIQSGDRELVQFYADPEAYHQTRIGAIGQTGEMGTADITGDTIPELLVAGDVGEWWLGTQVEGENGLVWAPETRAGRTVVAQLTGPVLPYDDDGDPKSADFLAFAQEGTATELRAFEVGVGPSWRVVLNTSLETGLDLAICGDFAWALTPTAVYRVSLNNHSVTGSLPISATKLDCGEGPNGASVAVLTSDAVNLYNDGLGLVGTEAAPGARDVVIYQAATPKIGTCAVEGCSVARWSRASGDVLVESAGGSTTLHLGTGDVVAKVGGALSTADVDGDGSEDLTVIAHEAGVESRVGLWRDLGEAVGVPEVFHCPIAGEGPLLFTDANADGLPDAWIRTGGDLFIPAG